MAAHGARRLSQMVTNLNNILGVELLCAAQGVEFRAPLATSTTLQTVIARLRDDVAALAEDRFMAPDLNAAGDLVASAALLDAIEAVLPELGA